MPSGYSRRRDGLTDREKDRLVSEYVALPRRPDGRVQKGFTGLLARKWGLSQQHLINTVNRRRAERQEVSGAAV